MFVHRRVVRTDAWAGSMVADDEARARERRYPEQEINSDMRGLCPLMNEEEKPVPQQTTRSCADVAAKAVVSD
jgi:hypothetical protein